MTPSCTSRCIVWRPESPARQTTKCRSWYQPVWLFFVVFLMFEAACRDRKTAGSRGAGRCVFDHSIVELAERVFERMLELAISSKRREVHRSQRHSRCHRH
jgi:hypothetical protein